MRQLCSSWNSLICEMAGIDPCEIVPLEIDPVEAAL